MTQSIEIKTDSPDEEAREVLTSALRQYKFIAEYKAKRYVEKCAIFEAKYEMDSSVFLQKFECGGIGDEDDFFDWYAAKRGLDIMNRKLEVIKGIKVRA